MLALGAVLHRSAFGLLPAAAVAWAMWLRARGAGALRRPLALVALLLPVVVMAIMVPRIVADVRRWDVVHFAPAELRTGGGPLRAAFADGRPLDLLNLVLVLSPLAIPALIAALAAGPRRLLAREVAPLLALALPFVLVGPFIHPVQGLFRDWDDYAVAAVTLSLLAAYAVGEVLRADAEAHVPARRGGSPAAAHS